jgi:hypothetical protein
VKKFILYPALLGFLLASLFLISVGGGPSDWHPAWMLQPLILVTAAGATAGSIHGGLAPRFFRGKYKILHYAALGLLYLVAYWMGMVLGFHGTYWH